jgi:hypothetical protein
MCFAFGVWRALGVRLLEIGFSFCETPCLLDAATKSGILELENRVTKLRLGRNFPLIVEVQRDRIIQDTLAVVS